MASYIFLFFAILFVLGGSCALRLAVIFCREDDSRRARTIGYVCFFSALTLAFFAGKAWV